MKIILRSFTSFAFPPLSNDLYEAKVVLSLSPLRLSVFEYRGLNCFKEEEIIPSVLLLRYYNLAIFFAQSPVIAA